MTPEEGTDQESIKELLYCALMYKIKELADNVDSSVNTFPENMICELFDQSRVAQIFYAPDVNKVKELADNLDTLFNTFLIV